MLPYKTRRTAYALWNSLLGLYFFWMGWRSMKTSRELFVANMAMGFAQIVVAFIIWKRRNRPPPPSA